MSISNNLHYFGDDTVDNFHHYILHEYFFYFFTNFFVTIKILD